MSITKILAQKDVEAADKLAQVQEIVAKARKAYGNTDAEIKDVKVDTVYGYMNFSNLEAESQVELLRNEAMKIKAQATQYVENNEGTVIGQKVTELLAVNPLFNNVSAEAGYDYL